MLIQIFGTLTLFMLYFVLKQRQVTHLVTQAKALADQRGGNWGADFGLMRCESCFVISIMNHGPCFGSSESLQPFCKYTVVRSFDLRFLTADQMAAGEWKTWQQAKGKLVPLIWKSAEGTKNCAGIQGDRGRNATKPVSGHLL